MDREAAEDIKRHVDERWQETRRHFEETAAEMRRDLARSAAESRRHFDERADEMRHHFAESAEETKHHFDLRADEIRAHADERAEETKRHFEVVAESLRSEIRLVAEGLGATNERLDGVESRMALADDVRDLRAEMSAGFRSVREEMGELKAIVGRGFSDMDRRVTALEKRASAP